MYRTYENQYNVNVHCKLCGTVFCRRRGKTLLVCDACVKEKYKEIKTIRKANTKQAILSIKSETCGSSVTDANAIHRRFYSTCAKERYRESRRRFGKKRTTVSITVTDKAIIDFYKERLGVGRVGSILHTMIRYYHENNRKVEE